MKKLLCICSVVLAFCFTEISKAQQIITIAGNNRLTGYSGDGGPATAAEININTFYSGVAFDNSGNTFFVDGANNVIRKINSSGIISTYAGIYNVSGYYGDGGPATAAEFSGPCSIAADYKGNIYIADEYNDVIRKVNSSGVISTVAGNNASSYGYSGDGGPATNAELNYPMSVAADSAGDIYIADERNFIIRKVNTTGIITTAAGTPLAGGYSGDGGPATAAELNGSIFYVSNDTKGNFYIVDCDNFRFREVNTSGVITTIAGNGVQGIAGSGGPATAASFQSLGGLAVDSAGNIWLSVGQSEVDEVVKSSGIVNTIIGAHNLGGYYGDGGPAFLAEVDFPEGIAFDKHWNLVMPDPISNDIREINNAMKVIFGYTYYDYWNNCDYNGSPMYTNVKMELITPTDTLSNISDENSLYWFCVPKGTYTVVFDSTYNSGYKVICPSSHRITVTAPADTVVMGFSCPGTSFDLAGNLSLCIDTPLTNSSTATISACIFNNYCALTSGTLNLIIDTNIKVTSWVAPSAPSIIGDTMKWNFSNLSVSFNQNQCVSVTGIVKDSLAIATGDSNYVTMYLTPVSGDTAPSNNLVTYWVKKYPRNCVGLPYDPNNKSVYPEGNINSAQKLDYTIEFQNTGNATATNVIIYDTLSPYVDITTLSVKSSSFPLTTRIIGNNIVEFIFSSIYLPDSTGNQIGSKGNVMYSIMPNPNLPNGTRITNKAGIYFDANPEIQTNTTLNTIDTAIHTGVAALAANTQHFICFPNPFTTTTTVLFNTHEKHYLEVDDLTGRKLKWIECSGTQYSLSMEGLSQGIYFLRAFDNNQHYISTQKLVVEK